MMSVTSKIPQNRGSRLAAPSKLPSRILRPTFTNKTQSTIPNFVSSAKQIEKRKETTSQAITQDSLQIDSNLNIKSTVIAEGQKTSAVKSNNNSTELRTRTVSTVDCNGNKRLQDKKTVSENQDDQEAISGKDGNLKMYSPKSYSKIYDDQNATVIATQGSYSKRNCDAVQRALDHDKRPSSASSTSPNRGDSTSPNFRSMKPGYFLQKVNAIKSSHQKAFAERQGQQTTATQPQPFGPVSKLTLPSRTASFLNRGPAAGKNAFVTKSDEREEKVVSTSETSTASAVLRPPTQVGKSRLATKSTGPPPGPVSMLNKPTAYVSRAEKRKKYLEGKNALKNTQENEKMDKTGLSLPLHSEEIGRTMSKRSESAIGQTSGSDPALRRPYFRRQVPRSAKIARPVTRPKKTPSPITPVPFTPCNQEHVGTIEPEQSAPKDFSNPLLMQDTANSSELNSLSVTHRIPQDVLVQNGTCVSPEKHDADHHSDASALSEESGYSSITSTMHLNTRKNESNTASPPTGFTGGWKWKSRACWSETDAAGPRKVPEFGKARRPLSHSLSDMQSTNAGDTDRRSLEHQRYLSYLANKNLVTFGQYRVQVEGNYATEHRFGTTEGGQIRSSIGNDEDLLFREKTESSPSPECENENASDSSVETVIPNTRSPQPADGVGHGDCKEEEKPATEKLGTSAGMLLLTENLELTEESENNLDDVFHVKQGGKETQTQHGYQFISASDETLFMSPMHSPGQTQNKTGTPSTNSAHKSKKRKTDSVLMSPLLPDDEVEGTVGQDGEKASDDSTLERKIIFDDDHTKQNLIRTSSLDDSTNEESFSELIDLPSLHGSTLMTDYNSILEDDLSSDADSDQEEDSHNKAVSTHPPSPGSKIVNMSQNVQTNVINKLLSKGVNGIVRSDEDIASTLSGSDEPRPPSVKGVQDDRPLTNGYHTLEESSSLGHSVERQILNDSAPDHPPDMMIHEIIQEYRVMKMSLAEVYRILEADEEKMEKQVEENRRLQMKNQKQVEENKCLHVKNQKLAETVENLTRELSKLKVTAPQHSPQNKGTQIEIDHADASTHTEPDLIPSDQKTTHSQDAGAQAVTSPRWYHTEVSNEVQSNIEVASEEIKFLKDLRGDFDKRINDAERRLHSALQLMHR